MREPLKASSAKPWRHASTTGRFTRRLPVLIVVTAAVLAATALPAGADAPRSQTDSTDTTLAYADGVVSTQNCENDSYKDRACFEAVLTDAGPQKYKAMISKLIGNGGFPYSLEIRFTYYNGASNVTWDTTQSFAAGGDIDGSGRQIVSLGSTLTGLPWVSDGSTSSVMTFTGQGCNPNCGTAAGYAPMDPTSSRARTTQPQRRTSEIDSYYNIGLGRLADTNGYLYYMSVTSSNCPGTMPQVAATIYTSQEFYNHMPVTSGNYQPRIANLYQGVLRRIADTSGSNYWQSVATSQGWPAVVNGLLGSGEYAGRANLICT